MEGILLPQFPSGSLAHIGRLQSLLIMTSSFTDMAGDAQFRRTKAPAIALRSYKVKSVLKASLPDFMNEESDAQ